VKRSEQELLQIEQQQQQQVMLKIPRDDNGDDEMDHPMPDVNDSEAGFYPTEDQPYRRLRRHTVT
jgi:hypothetical protein